MATAECRLGVHSFLCTNPAEDSARLWCQVLRLQDSFLLVIFDESAVKSEPRQSVIQQLSVAMCRAGDTVLSSSLFHNKSAKSGDFGQLLSRRLAARTGKQVFVSCSADLDTESSTGGGLLRHKVEQRIVHEIKQYPHLFELPQLQK